MGTIGKMIGLCVVEVPVDLFSFLFVTVVNGKESTIMLVAVVYCSCSTGRELGAALEWNAMVIGIAFVGLVLYESLGMVWYHKKFLWQCYAKPIFIVASCLSQYL